MPIFSQYLNHPTPLASAGHDPSALIVVGAHFSIEFHVPTVVARFLANAGRPVPLPLVGLGIIDTGATVTAVHEPAFQSLGLTSINTIQMGTANGPVTQNVYPARIVLPAFGVAIDPGSVVGVNLTGQTIPLAPPQPLIALIGRDILAGWVLIWNGPAGTWTVAR